MLVKLFYCVVTGLLVGILAIGSVGCKLPDMFGGVEAESRVISPGGRGWVVSGSDDLALVIHRSVEEFVVAPVTLDLPDGWWKISAVHEFPARGLHRLSFNLRSLDDKAVPVRFVVVAQAPNEWLAFGDFEVDSDGTEVNAAFHYKGTVLFYFFPLDVHPFVVRDFAVTDVQINVPEED